MHRADASLSEEKALRLTPLLWNILHALFFTHRGLLVSLLFYLLKHHLSLIFISQSYKFVLSSLYSAYSSLLTIDTPFYAVIFRSTPIDSRLDCNGVRHKNAIRLRLLINNIYTKIINTIERRKMYSCTDLYMDQLNSRKIDGRTCTILLNLTLRSMKMRNTKFMPSESIIQKLSYSKIVVSWVSKELLCKSKLPCEYIRHLMIWLVRQIGSWTVRIIYYTSASIISCSWDQKIHSTTSTNDNSNSCKPRSRWHNHKQGISKSIARDSERHHIFKTSPI